MPRLSAQQLWADVSRIRIELTAQDSRRLGLSDRELTSFGSGRLIGRNLLLTARHVLESTGGVALPDKGWEVRLLGDQINGKWVGEPVTAQVIWRGSDNSDLALLQLEGPERRPNECIRLRLGREQFEHGPQS